MSIAYWVRLQWNALSICFTSVLSEGREYQSLRSLPEPQPNGDSLIWEAPPLDLRVSMSRRQPPLARRLFESPEGVVDWNCELPVATAEFRHADRTTEGYGYAELLEMTLAPWRLPIDELRWGRFAANNTSVVWIDWRGESPQCIVFRRGLLDEAAQVFDQEVILGGHERLSFSRTNEIRSRQLGAIAGDVPLLRNLLPRRLMAAHEQKWCSPATLHAEGEQVCGWVVHELVRFGKS